MVGVLLFSADVDSDHDQPRWAGTVYILAGPSINNGNGDLAVSTFAISAGATSPVTIRTEQRVKPFESGAVTIMNSKSESRYN
jgi:hypothetical protein